jgi:ankyrin repeat protein
MSLNDSEGSLDLQEALAPQPDNDSLSSLNNSEDAKEKEKKLKSIVKDEDRRRKEVYKWYKHFAKPTKETMCRIAESTNDAEIVRLDVDLLPWNAEETEVIKEAMKSLKKDKTEKKEKKKKKDGNKSKKKISDSSSDDSDSADEKISKKVAKKKKKKYDSDSSEDDRKKLEKKKKEEKKKKKEDKLIKKLSQSTSTLNKKASKLTSKLNKSASKLSTVEEATPPPEPLPKVEEYVKKVGRYTIIDPNVRYTPKIHRNTENRTALPVFDEPPDWMFNAEAKEEARGVFNVRGGLEKDVAEEQAAKKKKSKEKADEFDKVGADAKAYAKQFMKDQQRSKKFDNSKGLSASFTVNAESGVNRDRAERLYKCLNKDPAKEHSVYSDDDFMDLIIESPIECKMKYAFDAFSDDPTAKMYPLSMLCALGASITAIRECYEAHKIAIHEKDIWIGTPLHYACIYGASLKVIKYLVGIDNNLLKEVDKKNLTPIHVAIISEAEPEVVSFLAEASIDSLQMVDMNGMMPLHLACDNDTDADVVKEMVNEYPVACVARNFNGMTPLHIAVGHKAHLSLLKALVKGHEEAVKIADNRGRIPLHIAVDVQADYKIVRLLVKYFEEGIDVKNNLNQTPLETAEKMSVTFDERVLELLRPYIESDESDE